MQSAHVKIAVSACLLGDAVRYDGKDKRCPPVVELGRRFLLVPICPEVELGMPVPREPIELRWTEEGLRLLGRESGRDWTDSMGDFARRRIGQLIAEGVGGFVLKSKSPSCGVEDVATVQRDGTVTASGTGRFADILRTTWPDLPIENETGIADPVRRQAFLQRLCRRRP